MHQTLIEGDYVLVNKFAYGARIPITPFYVNWIQLPYWRMPGYTSVQRNDVIVFNFPDADPKLPIDKREEYVKRCVGLPGDSISIVAGDVFINGKKLAEPANVLHRYGLALGNGFPDSSVMRQLEICPRAERTGYGGLLVLVSEKNADSLRHVHNITSVT
jgi:signal peptidase I